jgi:hypothetical protein
MGLVSRVSPVQTALRNCTRDEGRSFEVGNQVLAPELKGFRRPDHLVSGPYLPATLPIEASLKRPRKRNCDSMM